MNANQIRVKTNKLAALRRASTILAQNSVSEPLELRLVISAKHDEIMKLCIDEIKSPTNPDDFVSAVCKLARGRYAVLRKIAEDKIKAKLVEQS